MYIEHPKRTFLKDKAKYLYEKYLDMFNQAPIKGPSAKLKNLLTAFHSFYGRLAEPITSSKYLVGKGSIPTVEFFEELHNDMTADLNIAFSEQGSLNDAMVTTFNFVTAKDNLLSSELDSLRSTVTAAITNGIIDNGPAIKIADNFNSYDFIDFTASVGGTYADINTGAGVVTLRKVEETTYRGDTTPLEISYNKEPSFKLAGMLRYYSGKLHGVVDRDNNLSVEDMVRLDVDRIVPEANGLYKMVDNEQQGDGRVTIWEREVTCLDSEPDIAGNDPNWNVSAGQDRIISDIDADSVRTLKTGFRVKRLPITRDQAYDVVKRLLGDRLEYFNASIDNLRYIWNSFPYNPETGDGIYPVFPGMEIIVTIDLKGLKKVGNLNISPHLFGRAASAKVEDISVFDDDRQDWVSVTGSQDTYTLYNEGAGLYQDTSWVFGNMNISRVKISLRQTSSYKQKYEMYAKFVFSEIRMRRANNWGDPIYRVENAKGTLMLIDYQGKALADRLEVDVKNRLDREGPLDVENNPVSSAREIDFAAITTIPATIDTRMAEIGEEMYRKAIAADGTEYDSPIDWYLDGRRLDDRGADREQVLEFYQRYGQALFSGIAGKVAIPSTVSNRNRYAIGIRDLSLTSVVYSGASEFVSKAWNILYPAGLISLKVDETIPPSFTLADPNVPWISYYVSVDGGATFYEIAPVGNKPAFRVDEAGKRYQIPTVLRINSDIPVDRRNIYPWGQKGFIDTAGNPSTIIFKARLTRPEPGSLEGVYSTMTPKLSYYELLVTPAGR